MQYRALGQSGIQASVVGLGAWAIGGWMWGGTDRRAAVRGIQAGIEEGMTLVDTAPVYGFGLSESIVGEAIRDRRDKVVLATKCGLVWDEAGGELFFTFKGEDDSNRAVERAVHRFLGPASIRREVDASLRRLGTDHIDLLQTHWQDSTTPIADTMAELLKLKEEGKIRAIGVSNATVDQLDEYRAVGIVDSDQERYSMLDRKREADLLPYVASNAIAFLAYSPIEQGLLTGKVGPDRVFKEGDQRADHPRFSVESRRKIAAMLEEFKPTAVTHDLTLAQLVIAWTFHQPGCTHALVGARNPEQARENAKAGDVRLSDEERARLAEIIQRHTD